MHIGETACQLVVTNAHEPFMELIKLSGLDVTTDLKFLCWDRTDFGGATLDGFDFRGASLMGCRWRDARVKGIRLAHATISKVELAEALDWEEAREGIESQRVRWLHDSDPDSTHPRATAPNISRERRVAPIDARWIARQVIAGAQVPIKEYIAVGAQAKEGEFDELVRLSSIHPTSERITLVCSLASRVSVTRNSKKPHRQNFQRDYEANPSRFQGRIARGEIGLGWMALAGVGEKPRRKLALALIAAIDAQPSMQARATDVEGLVRGASLGDKLRAARTVSTLDGWQENRPEEAFIANLVEQGHDVAALAEWHGGRVLSTALPRIARHVPLTVVRRVLGRLAKGSAADKMKRSWGDANSVSELADYAVQAGVVRKGGLSTWLHALVDQAADEFDVLAIRVLMDAIGVPFEPTKLARNGKPKAKRRDGSKRKRRAEGYPDRARE